MTTHNKFIDQSRSERNKMSNFHEENAKLLFNDDWYCIIAYIPQIIKNLGIEAAEKLIDKIKQKILNDKLLESLKIKLINGEIMEVDVYKVYLEEIDHEVKSWESLISKFKKKYHVAWWEDYFNLSKLMISVQDIIEILKDVKLDNISKLLSSVIYKPICKHITKEKRDKEIIKQYQDRKIENPKYSDSEIARIIKQSAEKHKKIQINQEINKLSPRTIEDIISNYIKTLIKNEVEKRCKFYKNIQIPEETFKDIRDNICAVENQFQQKILLVSEVEKEEKEKVEKEEKEKVEKEEKEKVEKEEKEKVEKEDKDKKILDLANFQKHLQKNLSALNHDKELLSSELEKTQLKAEEAGVKNNSLNTQVERLTKILSDKNMEVEKQRKLLRNIEEGVEKVKTIKKMFTDLYLKELDEKFIKDIAEKFQKKEHDVHCILSTITSNNNYIYKLDLPPSYYKVDTSDYDLFFFIF